MTDDSRHELYNALADAIQEHPGTIAESRWRAVHRTNNVFSSNCRELLDLITGVETNFLARLELLRDTAPQRNQAMDDFVGVLDQRLHNTLASATTLVDHARAAFSAYEGKPFFEMWRKRSEAVRDAPVSRFVKDLRNYVVHVRQPPYRFTERFSATESYGKLYMPGSILLLSDRWTAPAKQYIEDAGSGGVHLRSAIEDYEHRMRTLYTWAFRQFDSLHGHEVAEVNALVMRQYALRTG